MPEPWAEAWSLPGAMVDLGWPWWVTTIIAAGVVVACLALWRVIPHTPTRAVLAILVLEGVAIAIAAPFLMRDMGGEESTTGMAASGTQRDTPPPPPLPAATPTSLPFSFFLTHYVLLGSDPNNPTGVRYENGGRPFAKAADGSTISLTGQGGWDPAGARAEGGGGYVITDRSGAVRQRGTWRATRFVSFEQVAGWWGLRNFKEEGWQGPPGSPSFSGFLKLRVNLAQHGEALLTAWCLMPGVKLPPGHQGDGISLVGNDLAFTNYRESEVSAEGLMFYGPASRQG